MVKYTHKQDWARIANIQLPSHIFECVRELDILGKHKVNGEVFEMWGILLNMAAVQLIQGLLRSEVVNVDFGTANSLRGRDVNTYTVSHTYTHIPPHTHLLNDHVNEHNNTVILIGVTTLAGLGPSL